MVRGHPETGSVRLVGVLMGFGESDQVARYQYSSAVYSCRSPVGCFDQFLPTSLSVGCRFGQRTFAGATRNGKDAPKAAVPVTLIERSRSTRLLTLFFSLESIQKL